MFKCALGKCRLEVCLVFMLCISEFVKYWSLLFDIYVSKESICCYINGKMFNSLNRFLHDSLLPRPIIILIAFYLHPKYLSTMGGISPEYYSISHYSMEEGMVYHNNSIFTYIRLNWTNHIASSAQFIY
jgi:hypothetical protein